MLIYVNIVAALRFVFVFVSCRACRACRASGRGEAVRAHVGRCSYRWASRVLALPCVRASGAFGVNILCTGAWVLTDFARFFPN